MHFEGEGYKYTNKGKEIKSRDDIIKSGWGYDADIFKVNMVLKSFSARELSIQEMLEYIIKDSVECMTLNSPSPSTSDFGITEADSKKYKKIEEAVWGYIPLVLFGSYRFSKDFELHVAITMVCFLLIYCLIWNIYFIKSKSYKSYALRISYFNKVVMLYRYRYNELVEIEKENERRRQEEELKRQEEERRREAEEKRRQEFERKKRADYWHNLMNNPDVSNQEKGRIFEEAMSELFERLGYKSDLTRATKDGGIDIVLYKDGKKYFVQCKFHKNNIGVEPVKQLWADKDVYGADKVIMLTYAGISKDAKNYINMINKNRKDGNLYIHFNINNILNLYEKADKM